MQDDPDCNLKRPMGFWPLERALLVLLLSDRPGQLTCDELRRELGETAVMVEHAIDALVGAGLARREGELVLPTPGGGALRRARRVTAAAMPREAKQPMSGRAPAAAGQAASSLDVPRLLPVRHDGSRLRTLSVSSLRLLERRPERRGVNVEAGVPQTDPASGPPPRNCRIGRTPKAALLFFHRCRSEAGAHRALADACVSSQAGT
jgi:hypothetical protein